jgi:hypothetical protein
MTDQRYDELMSDKNVELTDAEFADGWHFCFDWDGQLVGPGMQSMQFCRCKGVNKTKHKEFFPQTPFQGYLEDWGD